jgi:hypothetical protein
MHLSHCSVHVEPVRGESPHGKGRGCGVELGRGEQTSLSSWWRLLLSITLITLRATKELHRRSTALRTWLLAPAPINCGAAREHSRAQQTPAVQANCRTHRPQKLKCLISLCTNPVSILSVPIQTVR